MVLLPEFPGLSYFWFSTDRLWAICAYLLPGRTDFNLTLPHTPKRKICMWKSWLWQPQYHQGEERSVILAGTLHRGCQGCKGSRKHRSPHLCASTEIVLSLHSEGFWWVFCKHFQAFPKNKRGRWLQVISSTTRFRLRASFQWRKLKKEINNYIPWQPYYSPSTGIPSTGEEKAFQEEGAGTELSRTAGTELSRTDEEAGWNFMGERSQCWDFRSRGTWSGGWEEGNNLMTEVWTDWTEGKIFLRKWEDLKETSEYEILGTGKKLSFEKNTIVRLWRL